MGALVHLAKGIFYKGIDMDFFHLPSSSNAANDVKQLVRRRAFPRAIVGCYCFAEIVQNTQGGQCLQPTAIYSSYQFFCLQVFSSLAYRLSIFSTNLVFQGPFYFAWRCNKGLRDYRNRSRATSTTTRGLLMSHGHPLGKA